MEVSQISYSKEISRKAIHLTCLLIPLGLAFLPRHVVIGILIPITIFYTGADLLRLVWNRLDTIFQRIGGPVFRPHEARRLTGATYLLTATVISILVFKVEIAISGLLFLILGDTAGAIIGRKFGRIRIFNKTLEGTLSCFAACLFSGFFVQNIEWSIILVGSIVATIIELLPIPIDDNFSIPLVSGVVMQIMG